jgi:DNA-binding CsgD family transcriptional regulator/PAS domain-containing protein
LISTEQLSSLLHTLYSAPTSPELWDKFLLDFTALVGLPGAAILHQDLTNEKYGFSATSNFDPEGVLLYEEHYGKIDEWRPRFLNKVEGELAFGDDLSAPDYLRKTEFYNDYLIKFDIKLFCAIPLLKRETSFELISFYESWHVKTRRAIDTDLIELMLPHLRSALSLRHSLRLATGKCKEFEDTLDLLTCGVILFDANGNCLFLNKEARRIIVRGDGILLIRSRLCAKAPTESALLRAHIERALLTGAGKGTFGGGALLISRDSGKALQIVISPFSSENILNGQRALAIGFISDPDMYPAQPKEILKMLYGLTQAECRLVNLLMQGLSLSEVGQLNGLTQNTLRSQLKSVFQKTDVRKQSELIRQLAPIVLFGRG